MSPTTWTPSAVRPEALEARPWRVVEAQHVVATRKLVDSAAEQAVLEDLIERAKPPVPPEPELAGLHYLLATPFRHPPLPRGSRFGTRAERGLWYGADRVPTALAEATYYRLVFLEGTAAEIEPILVDLSVFRAAVRTARGIDLTSPRSTEGWAEHESEISSPTSYTTSQELGRALRAAGVEAFRYRSARDPERGTNLALFTPRAFAAKRPDSSETWYCVATRSVVELSSRRLLDRGARGRETHRFPRELFEVDGKLPAPAV